MANFAMTLNRRVELLRQAGEDDLGQPLPDSWSPVARAWANVRNPRGAEVIRAGGPSARVQVSIRMRMRSDVVEGMRIRDGATVYDVKAVLQDMVQRRHLDLVCEVVP